MTGPDAISHIGHELRLVGDILLQSVMNQAFALTSGDLPYGAKLPGKMPVRNKNDIFSGGDCFPVTSGRNSEAVVRWLGQVRGSSLDAGGGQLIDGGCPVTGGDDLVPFAGQGGRQRIPHHFLIIDD